LKLPNNKGGSSQTNYLIGIAVRSLSAGSHWLDLSSGDLAQTLLILQLVHHQNKLKTLAAITALKVVALMHPKKHMNQWIIG